MAGVSQRAASLNTNAGRAKRQQSAPGFFTPYLYLLPLVSLAYSLLLPLEVRVSVAGQTFYPYRIVCILIVPWFLRRVAAKEFQWDWIDGSILLAAFWMIVSFIVRYGPLDGILRGGSLAFDLAMPYLAAKLTIRTKNDFRLLLILFLPGLILTGFFLMLESVSHRVIVRAIAADIFGSRAIYEEGSASGEVVFGNETRLGLMRASGPFAHPILAGLFFGSFLPLVLGSSFRGWPRYGGLLAALFAVFSVSSAAFLSLMLGSAFTIYDRLQRVVEFANWRMLLLGLVLISFGIHLASENGFFRFLIRYTLDPQTGFYRLLIWEYGLLSVANHPWFGIGFDRYEALPWMVASVDTHWLMLAIRHGLITPFALFIGSAAVVYKLAIRATGSTREHDGIFYVGLAISLAVLMLLAFTVAYFGAIQTWFCIVIGCCAGLVTSADRPVRK